MPNWCEHDFYITGKKTEVDEILKKIQGVDKEGNIRPIDFNSLLPYPEKLRTLDEIADEVGFNPEQEALDKALIAKDLPTMPAKEFSNGYNMGGYEWCINTWGTKWNAAHITEPNHFIWKSEDKEEYQETTFSFETPWSPPEGFIEELAKLTLNTSVEIYIKYFECGMGFHGRYSIKEGFCDNEVADYFGDRGG